MSIFDAQIAESGLHYTQRMYIWNMETGDRRPESQGTHKYKFEMRFLVPIPPVTMQPIIFNRELIDKSIKL